MNGRDYDVTYGDDELVIRRKSDHRKLTVCFWGTNHESAVNPELDALKYVRSFVDEAIDDQQSSAMRDRDFMHERHSGGETAEHMRLVEVLEEDIQAAELMDEEADDDIRQEAEAKRRNAREAICKAAVRNACRVKGLGLEATEEVMKKVFVWGVPPWRAIESAQQQQQQQNPSDRGIER